MVGITKISSKGQVVIPFEIRERMKVKEGNLFIVTQNEDSICLKKIELPKVKTWNEVTKPFRDATRKSNFTKEDLEKVIKESRIKRAC